MKLYAVTITYTAIVRARDAADAELQAENDSWEIVHDLNSPEYCTEQQITNPKQLEQYGWDADSPPYGDGDGNTSIGEYLAQPETN